MTERGLATELRQDLQRAAAGRGRVLYLEGKTDVPILLGLLGAQGEREVPGGVLHDGVLIRGLSERGGSGRSAVAQRLAVAVREGYPGIFGVIDGDGEPLAALAPEFDAPHSGPRFRWKTYCVENLLVLAGWPTQWDPAPDWQEALAAFAPYVALNRLGSGLRERLRPLQLDRMVNPPQGRLYTADEILGKLRAGKHELAGLDVEAMFAAELELFRSTLARDVAEAHALVNGKWLVNLFAAQRTGRTPAQCRDDWTGYLREAGGSAEIRCWWRRTIAPVDG